MYTINVQVCLFLKLIFAKASTPLNPPLYSILYIYSHNVPADPLSILYRITRFTTNKHTNRNGNFVFYFIYYTVLQCYESGALQILFLTLTVVPNSSIQIVFPTVIYKEDLKFNQIFSIDEDFGNPFINNIQIINL